MSPDPAVPTPHAPGTDLLRPGCPVSMPAPSAAAEQGLR
jgi:hypothetical protein